jgi:hypothetical protein
MIYVSTLWLWTACGRSWTPITVESVNSVSKEVNPTGTSRASTYNSCYPLMLYPDYFIDDLKNGVELVQLIMRNY